MWRRADHIAAEICIDTFQKCEQGHDDMNSEYQEAMRILSLCIEGEPTISISNQLADGCRCMSCYEYVIADTDHNVLSKGETLEEAIIRLEKPDYRRPPHKDIGNGRAAKAARVVTE